MGWPREMKVLLIVLVFSKGPLTGDALLQNLSLAGMPLSEVEYESFFQTLTARRVVHAVCFRRAVLGCHDPAIQALDRYENHGVIPDGWICSDFPDNTSFPGFCGFALYRCIMKNYFAKRVLCPDETTQKPTVTQTNEEATVIATTETSFELPDPDPTTSTLSSPELLTATGTAGLGISPTSDPTTTAKASLLELLSSSAVETASKLIAQILTAFTAAKKHSSEPATSGIATEPLTELAAASASASATGTMTDESLIEVTSTTAIITEPELNPAATATGSPSERTTTVAATTKPSLELSTAVELFLESTSDTTTTSNTEPCNVDYPEALSSSTTLPSSTASTHTKATVPGFDASLPFPPLQPNSTMRILILSIIRDKKVKKGDRAGISALTQTGLGSDGNILQQEEILNPLSASGLRDLFLRLHGKNVQQLVHTMQNGMSGGEQKP